MRCFEQVKVHKKQKISWFILKKGRFERLNLEGGNVAGDCSEEDDIADIADEHILAGVQVKVHKSRKSAGLIFKKGPFYGLNLEGGNVASDRIVEDHIVIGHILAGILDK